MQFGTSTTIDLGRGHYDPERDVVVIELERRETETGELGPDCHRP
jgi:hypothetical protein